MPIKQTKLFCCFAFMAFLCGEFFSTVYARPQSTLTDSLLVVGDSLFAKKEYDAAKNVYKRILKIETDEGKIPAYVGMGRIALAREDWGDVREYFDEVLTRDPQNIEALYSLGIAYRESGKFKAFLLRKLDWDKSKKHFKKGLSIDSSYKDILYQYAKLKRYREKYKQAVQLAQAQLRFTPNSTENHLRLFRIYGYFIRHRNKEDVITWLQQKPWEHARYFIGEKLRREKALVKADSVLMNLLARNLSMPSQPVYLSLAKIYYEQGHSKQAESYYWRAVDTIENQLQAALVFEELKYIVTDEELSQYRSRHTASEWKNYFRTFWRKRNPLPAKQVNKRLTEHYHRLLYAEDNYEYDGFRTWFNNPDKLQYLDFPKSYSLNHRFNDKGLIYIRHGKPNDWAITTGQHVPLNESWRYYETQQTPGMTFHFQKENAPGNNWRFVPFLEHRIMYADRLEWGALYQRLYRANQLEIMQLRNEMAEDSKAAVQSGLTTDRHTWEKSIEPLPLPFSIVTFRGKHGNTEVNLNYAVPIQELKKESENKRWDVSLETGVAFHDTNWRPVFERSFTQQLNEPNAQENFWIDQFRFDVPPDSYHVAFHVQPMNKNLLGGYKFEKKIPNYLTSELTISDILLAENISPNNRDGKFIKNELRIVPRPENRFDLDKPLYIYFEIYNLTKNTSGKTAFSIEYTLKDKEKQGIGIRNLFGLLGGKKAPSITIQNEREGDKKVSIEYMAMDVGKAESGTYELSINIQDKNSNQVAQKTTDLILE